MPRLRVTNRPVLRALPVVWRASRLCNGILLVLLVAAAALGGTAMIVNGRVVGAIPEALRSGMESGAGAHLVRMLALAAGLGVASSLVGVASGTLTQVLTRHVTRHVQRLAMEAALEPAGMAHLEDSRFTDELALAMSTPGSSPFTLPQALYQIASSRLTASVAAVILFRFAWWAPLLLLAAYVLQHRYMNRELDLLFHFYGTATPETRRANYFREMALGPGAAKELRVFGLGDWAVRRSTRHWMGAMGEVWRKRRALRGPLAAQTLVEVAASLVLFVAIVRAGAGGRIGLGEVAMYLSAAAGMRSFGSLGDFEYLLRNSANSYPHLLDIGRVPSVALAGFGGDRRDVDGLPRDEIQLVGVRFGYQGAGQVVFNGLDLTIPAGRSLAIVGANGAGKTTLVKLLARLYDPDAGAVTVDGIDLRTVDPDAWRQRVAVVFQDFVQYPFTARDNVTVGAPDRTGDADGLAQAAALSGVDTLFDTLEHGWDTVLSRQYARGIDLSGGQWQRVALARALFATRRGGVLVLDEPTANLDVRSESELFDRFLDITAGATTVLISHRFSTVRRADQIVVLDQGRVIETGTHDQLVAFGGRYARMFALQAGRFTDDASEDATVLADGP